MLKVIESAEEFERVLEQERGHLQILVEWTLKAVQQSSVSSGREAAQCFREAWEEDPYHLHFRAFAEDVEYAWFGSTGLRVDFSQKGEPSIGTTEVGEEIQQYDWKKSPLRVRLLLQDGRTVYEKLLPRSQPSEHHNFVAETKGVPDGNK